jgi:regulator of replication initiation timing
MNGLQILNLTSSVNKLVEENKALLLKVDELIKQIGKQPKTPKDK